MNIALFYSACLLDFKRQFSIYQIYFRYGNKIGNLSFNSRRANSIHSSSNVFTHCLLTRFTSSQKKYNEATTCSLSIIFLISGATDSISKAKGSRFLGLNCIWEMSIQFFSSIKIQYIFLSFENTDLLQKYCSVE